MTTLSVSEIIDAWHINATPWIKAIANEQIESRIWAINKSGISSNIP